MIWLIRVDGSSVLVNEDQILYVEPGHDAVVSLANGEKLRVQHSAEDIERKILEWRRRSTTLDWLAVDPPGPPAEED